MDKSILPGMTRRSFPWFTGNDKKKKKKAPKQTQPGAMDDNAMDRVKKRNQALKDAAGD